MKFKVIESNDAEIAANSKEAVETASTGVEEWTTLRNKKQKNDMAGNFVGKEAKPNIGDMG